MRNLSSMALLSALQFMPSYIGNHRREPDFTARYVKPAWLQEKLIADARAKRERKNLKRLVSWNFFS